MKVFLGILVGIWVGFGVGCCSTNYNVRNDVSPAYESTVMLHAPSTLGENRGFFASGFSAVGKNKIMTAGHFCVSVFFGQAANRIKEVRVIYMKDKKKYLGGIAVIETVDEKRDLCIMNTIWDHGLDQLKFADENVEIFDNIKVLGAPRSHYPVQYEGRVIEPKTANYPEKYDYLNSTTTLSVPGTYGNSGGPVVNDDDEVVGVVMAKEVGFDHILFAVSLDTIKEFLKENNYAE